MIVYSHSGMRMDIRERVRGRRLKSWFLKFGKKWARRAGLLIWKVWFSFMDRKVGRKVDVIPFQALWSGWSVGKMMGRKASVNVKRGRGVTESRWAKGESGVCVLIIRIVYQLVIYSLFKSFSVTSMYRWMYLDTWNPGRYKILSEIWRPVHNVLPLF